jgi:lysyl-tRNA synthetase class 2
VAADTPSPWWTPGPCRPPAVPAGARAIKSACARWFEAEGFVEVEAAILQVSPGNETHLHGFATTLIDDAGEPAIPITCTPRRNSPARSCWRRGEGGSSISPASSATASAALHHPEFTMLEWYRAGRGL